MEQETEKPFDTVSIILLVMIAGTSDVADAVTVLIAAVPVIGQVAYFGNALLISPIVWATIQVWFIMKVGFSGRVGLLNLAGGIGNMIGLPGSETVTVLIATWLANHPKAAAIAQVASGKVSGATSKNVSAEKALIKKTVGGADATAETTKAMEIATGAPAQGSQKTAGKEVKMWTDDAKVSTPATTEENKAKPMPWDEPELMEKEQKKLLEWSPEEDVGRKTNKGDGKSKNPGPSGQNAAK